MAIDLLPTLGQRPTVSVVVPARNSASTLAMAIRAAAEQEPPPTEIVIALGPSDDETAAVAAELSNMYPDLVRVVPNPSGRTPDGLNAAIAASTGQVIARIDAHSIIPPGYLDTAVRVLRESGAGNVGGLQMPSAPSGFGRGVAAAMRSPLGSGGAAYRSGSVRGLVDTVYLGVFRREALEAVGGFDPVFSRNQDAELNLRLARAGYGVWLEPALQVEYRPRANVRGLAAQYFQFGRWRRQTARLHPGSLRLRQLAAPLLVLGVIATGGVSILRRDLRPGALVATAYVGAMGLAGLQASEQPRDAPATALALMTMHLAWGIGFLIGPPRRRRRPS